MLIKGFQKLTLLDYPGYLATTIFMGGCNMRCPFCHNAKLVTKLDDTKISQTEILNYLKQNQGKLDGVCITGGEALLQKDLKSFLIKIKKMGYLIKLDTNGLLPQKLEELINNHLIDYIAMDIKNTAFKYNETAGKKVVIENIKESINIIKNSGLKHEFRTTVVKEFHQEQDLIAISKFIYPSPYYLQQFIDSGDLIQPNLHAYLDEQLISMQKKCLSNTFVRGI